MSDDFPAAHSMDTCWFAVDRDGHLAVFDSGEEGAVPTEAIYDSGLDVPEQIALQAPQVLLTTLSAGSRHLQWPEFFVPPEIAARRPCWYRRLLLPRSLWSAEEWLDSMSIYSVVLLLSSAEVLRGVRKDRYRVGTRVERPEGSLWSVLFGRMNRGEYRRIHESGACFACIHLDEKGVSDAGLYRFDNDESGLEPYKRTATPKAALRLDDLPEELRRAAEHVRFNSLCFAEAECVQPLEHFRCQVYGPGPEATYLASDMKTRRPLPPESPV
jgi:hypothetical protein